MSDNPLLRYNRMSGFGGPSPALLRRQCHSRFNRGGLHDMDTELITTPSPAGMAVESPWRSSLPVALGSACEASA